MSNDALIERLEKATGPCRELDAAIALAAGYTTYPDGYGDGNEWVDPQGNHLPRAARMGAQPPKFTESIDSALTLADEETDPLDLLEKALRSCRAERDGVYFLPLHICIASLKARAGGEG